MINKNLDNEFIRVISEKTIKGERCIWARLENSDSFVFAREEDTSSPYGRIDIVKIERDGNVVGRGCYFDNGKCEFFDTNDVTDLISEIENHATNLVVHEDHFTVVESIFTDAIKESDSRVKRTADIMRRAGQ